MCTICKNLSTNIAPLWDYEKTYQVGDYVTYRGKLYKCKVATSAKEKDPTCVPEHWEVSDISEMIGGGGGTGDIKHEDFADIEAPTGSTASVVKFCTSILAKLKGTASAS